MDLVAEKYVCMEVRKTATTTREREKSFFILQIKFLSEIVMEEKRERYKEDETVVGIINLLSIFKCRFEK